MEMENFSKKRGRPRKIAEWQEALIREAHPDVWTKRSLNNKYYLNRAFRVLGECEDPKYDYLLPCKENRSMRRTILYALGRCEYEEEIRKMADVICKNRSNTADALLFIKFMKRIRAAADDEP